MSYIQKVLQPGESVLGTARLHWFIYLRAFFLFLLAVAALIGSTALLPPWDLVLAGFGGLFAIAALVAAFAALIRRATTELAVTDQRVIYKSGLVSRHSIEMNRSKVESVDVEQSLWGRIFGFGTLIVRGTGGSLEPIRGIGDPLKFRSYITAG